MNFITETFCEVSFRHALNRLTIFTWFYCKSSYYKSLVHSICNHEGEKRGIGELAIFLCIL